MDAGKAFLRSTNAHGVSVYSHLTEVLANLLSEKPDNALDFFEGVSLACKKSHYSAVMTMMPDVPLELPCELSELEHASQVFHVMNAKLLKPAAAEEEIGEQGEVRDVLSDRMLFEWYALQLHRTLLNCAQPCAALNPAAHCAFVPACCPTSAAFTDGMRKSSTAHDLTIFLDLRVHSAGAGLSTEDAYRVHASLLVLQQSKKLATLRFFGKVLGTSADYYVAEATYAEPPENEVDEAAVPLDVPTEESGTGCNAFVYFVTNDPADEWSVLPDVTPQQIVSSTKIRKYFTGSLSADVRAYPPFPGKEMEYLRALIARIVHATTICPVGKYVMPEDAEAGALPMDNEAEDYMPTAVATLGSVDGWCTRYYGILDIGRTTNLPREEEEGEDGEMVPKGPEPQPEKPPLSSVGGGEWVTAVYTHGGGATAVARSLLWPGAYCAYQVAGLTQVYSSFYIGWGHDALKTVFKMEPPPPFCEDPNELQEQVDISLDDENNELITLATATLAEEAAAMEEPAEE